MLGVVLIDYFSCSMTFDYIKHFISMVGEEKAFVVIDNSVNSENFDTMVALFAENGGVAADGAHLREETAGKYLRTVLAEYAGHKIILAASRTNLGFARGNNAGMEIAVEAFSPDRILFTNNDIKICSEDVVSQMEEVLNKDEKTAIVGPRVTGPDGERQSPHRQTGMFSRWIFPFLFWPVVSLLHKINKKLMGRALTDIMDINDSRVVYRVIGAFILVDTGRFGGLGGFDENTFLYGEEMILAERARRSGFNVFYLNSAQVIHYEGTLTGKSLNAGDKLLTKFRSESYYYKNYRNTPGFVCKIAELSLKFYMGTYMRIKKRGK